MLFVSARGLISGKSSPFFIGDNCLLRLYFPIVQCIASHVTEKPKLIVLNCFCRLW